MKPIIELNETNFESEVFGSTHPVLVDFWAEWCGPCKMTTPVLEEIATEYAGRVKIARVSVDENPALTKQYHIRSIPTLLYFAYGLVHDEIVGVADKAAILSKLDKVAAL